MIVRKLNPFRPKTVGYGIALLVISAVFFLSVWFRTPLELDIIKDRNRLFITNSEGFIVNIYKLRVLNKDQLGHTFEIELLNQGGLKYEGPKTIRVESEGIREVPVRVSIDPFEMKGSSFDIDFKLTSVEDDSISVVQPASFMGPIQRRRRGSR